jgi:hypothetical protein
MYEMVVQAIYVLLLVSWIISTRPRWYIIPLSATISPHEMCTCFPLYESDALNQTHLNFGTCSITKASIHKGTLSKITFNEKRSRTSLNEVRIDLARTDSKITGKIMTWSDPSPPVLQSWSVPNISESACHLSWSSTEERTIDQAYLALDGEHWYSQLDLCAATNLLYYYNIVNSVISY